MRRRLMQFMWGRYGMDRFSQFLLIVVAVFTFVNCFLRSLILALLVYALMGYIVFRFLSRNTTARLAENRAFNRVFERVTKGWKTERERRADRTHVYRKCPGCHAVLRLPRRKGKHTTSCPKCGKSFSVRVFWENKP